MINHIVFATTNVGKIKEAQEILEIDIQGTGLEIEEIQSLDRSKVAERKARDYYEVLRKPILVEDVSLEIEALNNLPGTYVNDFSKALGNDGICKLLEKEDKRDAVAYTTLVFIDTKGRSHEFVGETKGKIAITPRGTDGFGWDPIFVPEGSDKTFAEIKSEEKNKFSMRAKAFEKFKEWLNKKG